MELKKAIGVLETHNRWRRGEDVEPELKPKDIGVAIDTVVEYIKNNGVLDDVNKRAFNVTYLANDEIIKGLTVLADSEEEAMHKALLLRDSKDIYSAIEVNVC